MTRDEIKARVCALFEFGADKWCDYADEFMALAAEISNEEREACARIAETTVVGDYCGEYTAEDVAKLIRMRSNAEVSGLSTRPPG